MKKNSPQDLLDNSIEQLEALRDQELNRIKVQINEIHESLMPMNIIKDTLKTVKTSHTIKKKAAKQFIWLASGILVKNLIFRGTFSPMKLASRFLVQTFAAGLIYKNSDKIKSTGQRVLYSILSKH